MKGEGEHIRLACDKLWLDTQWLLGCDASMGPQPVAQRRAGDTAAQSRSCRDKLGAPEVVGANRKTTMKHPKKVTQPTVQMKCLCTNAHSLENKQEELEATVLLESYNVVAIIETCWDESHDWCLPIDGYRLFRRDRQGKRGGGVALYTKT